MAILRVGLLPCGKRKNEHPCAAKDMYLSGFFKDARFYVERTCADYLVITTKYGPCFPEQIIEPYDDYLGKKPQSAWLEWFHWIYPEPFTSMLLRKRRREHSSIQVWSCLPVPFYKFLHPAITADLEASLVFPFFGLQQGYRRQALKKLITERYSLHLV